MPQEQTIFHIGTTDCGARLVMNGRNAAIILEHSDDGGDMIDEPFEYAAEALQAKIADLPDLGYLPIEGSHVHFHFSHLERPEAHYILVGAEPQGKGTGATMVIPMQFILASLEQAEVS